MGSDAAAETCVTYIAGEVIVLRYRERPMRATGSRLELGEVTESTPLGNALGRAEGGHLVMDLVRVPPGLELRYQQLLAQNASVLVTSLNYVGEELGATGQAQGADGIDEMLLRWIRFDPSTGSCQEEDPVKLKDDKPLIVTVDSTLSHARAVLKTAVLAAKAYTAIELPDWHFIGVFARVSATSRGLYAYLEALARLQTLIRCPSAIVLSVDFGRACLRPPRGQADRRGGSSVVAGPAAVASYSFPLAEAVLRHLTRGLARKTGGHEGLWVPIFAAAGNRDGTLRHRLAYPALLCETIAVTHVSQIGNDWLPGRSSDLPLNHDLKPVFALPEALADGCGAPFNGTSFAAPWCAAWYLALRQRSQGGTTGEICPQTPLARVAWLQAAASPRSLQGGGQGVSWVQLIPRAVTVPARQPGLLQATCDRLRALNMRWPEFEFALTGSAAALLAYIGYHKPDMKTVAVSPGDIDLLYLGDIDPDDRTRRDIRDAAESAFRDLFASAAMEVELVSALGRVAPFHLFQCLVPATSLCITSGGVLDAWNGRSDIESGRLRVIEPPIDGRYAHPHARAEADARLPSMLIALAITSRLRLAAFRHGIACMPDLERVVAGWGPLATSLAMPRTAARFAKLVDVLSLHCSAAIELPIEPYWRRSLENLLLAAKQDLKGDQVPDRVKSVLQNFTTTVEFLLSRTRRSPGMGDVE